MLNVTKELTALARKLGYEGKAPDTVAKAIDAITSVAGESGGDYDPGYRVVETELFNETITTSLEEQAIPFAILSYNSLITEPSITVTFDDSTYTVPFYKTPMGYVYGETDGNMGPVFSTYPFLIISGPHGNTVYTETESTHTIAVTTPAIQASNDFIKALTANHFIVNASWSDELDGITLDKTPAEINEAAQVGYTCYIVGDMNGPVSPVAFNNNVFSLLLPDVINIQTDSTPPLLILNRYRWDLDNMVFREESLSYTLTPATLG